MIDHNRVLIMGKGPSSRFIKKKDYPNHTLVAVNQAAIMFDDIDFLFVNDLEGLYGIPRDVFSKIKNMVIPEYPHKNGWSKEDVTSDEIMNNFTEFPINFIIHDLWTSPCKNPNIVNMGKTISTSDTAISYFAKYENVKTFDLYGIGIENGYNAEIKEVLPKELYCFSQGWGKTRIGKMKENIEGLKNKYNLEINYN